MTTPSDVTFLSECLSTISRGQLQTYPGSISTVISVESHHCYVLNQIGKVIMNPLSGGVKTLTKREEKKILWVGWVERWRFTFVPV